VKLTFLGTGTSGGVPMIGCSCQVCRSEDARDKRLRSSVMLEEGETRVVIDCGPDFRQQMLREDVHRLDAIVFTHGHKDHTAGMDDVRPFNYFERKAIPLYVDELTEEALRKEYHYVFGTNTYPGIPQVSLHRLTGKPFDIGAIHLEPIRVMHLDLPVFGFRIGKLAYITDANRIDEAAMNRLRDLDILVINALRMTPHISHFSLPEALELIRELRPGSAYITHISHQMGTHASVEAGLPENVHLAYDGLRLEAAGF